MSTVNNILFLFFFFTEEKIKIEQEEKLQEIKEIEQKRAEKVAKRPPLIPKCYGPTKDCLKGMEDCSAANCRNCKAEDCKQSLGQICKNKKDGEGSSITCVRTYYY